MIKKIFQSSNLKIVGFVFVVVGLLAIIASFFKGGDNGTAVENKLSQLTGMMSTETGAIMLGLGLILVSVNRD